MALHVAASGAKAGQWVRCPAKPGNCKLNNGNSKHIEPKELYTVREWKQSQNEGRVYLKDITEQDVFVFENLPQQEQNRWEKAYEDVLEARKQAVLAKEQRERETIEAARNVTKVLEERNQQRNARLQRRTTPPAAKLPETKPLFYVDREGNPLNVDVKTYAYPAEDKRVLMKFYAKMQKAYHYNNDKDLETLIHYYSTHRNILDKYHKEDFVKKSFQIIGSRPRFFSSIPEYHAWAKYEEDVKINVALGSHQFVRNVKDAVWAEQDKKLLPKKVKRGFSKLKDQVSTKVSDEGIALPDFKVSESINTNESQVITPADRIGEAVGRFLLRFGRKDK